ncbi:MAG: 50S ribosomal protein L18 [Bacteroidia bacterium]|nr:50S ribosomal protein L18 [Bacteroidia bacterium]MCZ2278243.1 50S ribosomal protein L18 [Bacteroidia bacterium]
MKSKKLTRRKSIAKRIRRTISGTEQRPRLSVFRSNRQIYAQLIDDVKGHTLVAVSSAEVVTDSKIKKVETAAKVGKLIADKAIQAGISSVVFDRNGYLFHGRVKSLAEGAREGGLKF